MSFKQSCSRGGGPVRVRGLLILALSILTALPAAAAWQSLPVAPVDAVGRPAVAQNADGRWIAFTVRSDRKIWYSVSPAPTPPPLGAWDAWQPLDGQFCAGSSATAATDGEGRVYVFGVTCDGRIWHKWQLQIGLPHLWDTPWRQPRRTLDNPPVTSAVAPVVTRNVDGRLQLVTRLKSSDTVATMRQVSADPFAVWAPWEELGTDTFEGRPAVAANSDGRLEVFARSADGNVWHAWQDQATAGSTWSSWSAIPGNLESDPSAARNADGRLQVFAVTPGGYLWSAWQQVAGTTTNWSVWHLVGGDVTGTVDIEGDFLHGVEAIAGADGRLGVFVQDVNQNLWSRWQKLPSSSEWGYWTSACGESLEVVTAGSSAGPPELFARRADGEIWTKTCDPHCLGEDPKVVTVLNYHGFIEDEDDIPPQFGPNAFVKPSEFRKQLRHLRDEGFTPVDFSDLEQLCDVERPVIITADDGLLSTATELYPILGEAEFNTPTFTARAVSAPITVRTETGNTNYISIADIQATGDRFSFENHSHTHPNNTGLVGLDLEKLGKEMDEPNNLLTSWAGVTPSTLVFPLGEYDNLVLDETGKRFQYGATTLRNLYRLGQDRYRIPRRPINRTVDLATFIGFITLCEHSEYEVGVALEEGCGGGIVDDLLMEPDEVCSARVCGDAARAYCCDLGASAGWDADCVATARSVCDIGEP